MPLRSFYDIAEPDVVAEIFDKEIVILNLSDGKYFSLTGMAAHIWKDIIGGRRPANILEQLETINYQHVAAARSFISSLLEQKLIRPVKREGDTANGPLQSVKAATGIDASPPVLLVYEDMADLILADPIHDVEEDVGWPVKRDTDY